jgi:nucleolin
MSAASASSPVLPSLNHPNTIKSFYSKPNSLFFLSHSSTSSLKPVSLLLSFQHQQQPLSSRFLKNIAISSKFGQEEDFLSNGDEYSFSQDLKLFVGNLPFSVCSSIFVQIKFNRGEGNRAVSSGKESFLLQEKKCR